MLRPQNLDLEFCTFWAPTPISPTPSHCLRQPPTFSLYLRSELFFFFSDFTYKWDQTVFVFLCLTSLSQVF